MSSITAQQTKLDLELVPKEKRLEIGKGNERLNPRKKQREPTFQVVLDALALTPCYSTFLTTADVLEVYMHYFWDSIHKYDTSYRSLSGKTTGLDKLRLSRAQILWGMYYKKNVDYVELLWEDFTYQINNRDKTISMRNKIGMHTSRDDYLNNTLKFVSANEESQIYRARLPESMTSPEMRETKAYKTYLGYATGVTPLKKARKFKKLASPKLTTVLVSPEEPTRKSKRVKRPAKKSTNAPTASVIIRDTHMMSLSKKKEKMTVEKHKGIDLLSEVALTEEAQYEEVRKKSLRDFHKTHPSSSGIVTKIALSVAKIKPFVTNEGNGAKPGVSDVTKEDSSESEAEGSDQESDSGDDNTQSDNEKGSNSEHETDENDTVSESDQVENEEEVEDNEEEKEDESVKTPSNYTSTEDEDETNVESKVKDKAEGDEDKGIDYTTNQFDDDVDVRLNEPVNTDEGVLALEKEFTELKKDDLLNTQVTDLVDEHLDSRLGTTRDEFMRYLSASITARITKQVKIQLPQILPKEVSNFAPLVIKSMVTESLEHVILAKESSQPQSTYEVAASLTEFELQKILIDKMDESQSYLTATEHIECYEGLIKSRKDKDKDGDPSNGSDRGLRKMKTKEPEFEVAYFDIPQDQEENLGNDDEEPKRKAASKRDWFNKPNQPQEPIDPDSNVGKNPQQGPTQNFSAYIMNGLKITNLTQETLLGSAFKLLKGIRNNFAKLEYDFEKCYKALSEKLDWDNLEGGDYPFDLTKPLPLVMNGNRQIVPVNYFFNNDICKEEFRP
ncbi:hypothetical protein Tco_1273196 [Tanacetum coccineum]